MSNGEFAPIGFERSPGAGVPFVGRAHEIAILQTAVTDALDGRGRLILLAGDPGIGKTRTAEEVAIAARTRGMQVLWGRCYEGEGAPAFWPWVQVLRAATRRLPDDELNAALGWGAAELAHLVPEIRRRIPDLPDAAAPDSAQARFRLFESVARFLEAVSRHTPLVCIIDDLHGGDRPSLLLLEFVARELRDASALFVGTYRHGAAVIGHPLTELMVEALRLPGAERLTLSGLSPAEVTELVERMIGVRPSAALVAAVHRQTEGNPLYVSEYVRLLVARDSPAALADPQSLRTLPVPESVRAVVRCRMAPLSPRCRAALNVAAVIGREFRREVVEGVVAGDAGATRDADLFAVLDEAVTAGIIGESLERSGRYRFAHAVMREALYEDLGSGQRSRLHRQVGDTMEQLADADEHLAEIAYHFCEAGADVAPKAVDFARRAGDRATAVLAHEEAVRLYELALSVLDRMPGRDAHVLCAVLSDLGVAQSAAGDSETSKTSLLRAADIAKSLGLREELSRAALHFGSKFVWGDQPTPDPTRIELLEAALAMWVGIESPLHVRLLARLATALRFSDQHERRVSVSGQALEMARRLGDPAGIAYALHARHLAHWTPDNLDERFALAGELIELAHRIGDLELEFQGRALRFDDLFEGGERIAAEQELVANEQSAEAMRQPFYRWYTQNGRAMLLMMEGQFAAAERLMQENFAVGQSLLSGAAVAFGAQMFNLACAQGRREGFAAVAESVGQFVHQFPTFPAYRSAFAYIARELEQATTAHLEFEQLSASRFTDLPRDQMWFSLLHQLAEVCAFLRDTDRAEILVAQLAPYEMRALTMPASGAYFGSVSHYLGLLETTLCRWTDAARHFEHALEMNRRLRAWPWLARTQYEYARMLLARADRGDRERAQVLLQQALATATDLGMEMLVERVEKLAVASVTAGSIEPDAARLSAARSESGADAVFRREGDYWTIEFDGRTIRLRDSKGLQYLWHLIRNPNQQFLAADLIGQVSNGGDPTHGTSVGGPILDAAAKTSYKRRLDELRRELAEAESHHDIGRAEAARVELEALSDQLTAALGLGGRERKFVGGSERARWAVTKRIKQAIAKIRSAHPPLARHIAMHVKTGQYCTYQPDPDRPISWVSAGMLVSLRHLSTPGRTAAHLAHWCRGAMHLSVAHLHLWRAVHSGALHLTALVATFLAR